MYRLQFVRMCQQNYAVWKAMKTLNADVEIFVATDASGIAVGDVLLKLIDGKGRPVTFASQALALSTERKYRGAGSSRLCVCL